MDALPLDIIRLIAAIVGELSLALVSKAWRAACLFSRKRNHLKNIFGGNYAIHEVEKYRCNILFVDIPNIWTFDISYDKSGFSKYCSIYKNSDIVSAYLLDPAKAEIYDFYTTRPRIAPFSFSVKGGGIVDLDLSILEIYGKVRASYPRHDSIVFVLDFDVPTFAIMPSLYRQYPIEELSIKAVPYPGFYKGEYIKLGDETFIHGGITYPGVFTRQIGRTVLSITEDKKKLCINNLDTGKSTDGIKYVTTSQFVNGSVVRTTRHDDEYWLTIWNDDGSTASTKVLNNYVFGYCGLFTNIKKLKIMFVTKSGSSHTVDFKPTIAAKLAVHKIEIDSWLEYASVFVHMEHIFFHIADRTFIILFR